jgi:hypothetical protein
MTSNGKRARGTSLAVGLLTRAGHEFMAGRIVIPELCAGRPMWLIGRGLTEDLAADVPKYLGLPGKTPLRGWDQARGSASVCVVEGVFDVRFVLSRLAANDREGMRR